MKQHKKLIAFLMSAVMSVSTVLQCAGTVSAAEQQKGTAEAVPEMSASGTGGVGEVLAESINKETAKLQNAEGCNIFSIKTEDKRATVYFSAAEDCKLVVGVYTDLYEDGYEKMVVSAVTDVKAGQESAEVTFSTNSMPAYYVLKAYLIGKDGKLLSEEYVDQTYTKDIQTLMDSDINSYEGYEVLNLDENDNTNFVVYKKDVKVLHTTENENIVTAADDAAGIYSIRNVSEDIKTGDVVSVQGDSPDVVIFRVKSMETDGDLTTFEADTSMKPAEAFSYIKVEMKPEDFAEETTAEEETDPSVQKAPQGKPLEQNSAAYQGDEGWSGSKSLTLEKEMPNTPIDFKCGIGWNYTIRYNYYSTETHATSKFYLQSEVLLDMAFEFKAEFYVPLPSLSVKVNKFGVKLEVGLFLKLEIGGGVYGTMTLSSIVDSTGLHTDADVRLSVKAEVYAGIAIKVKGAVFGAEIEGEIGGGAYATFTPADPHPICSVCSDIELGVKGYFECKAGISFWALNWDAGMAGELSFKFSDAFWSDKIGFGLGNCPNKHITGNSASGSQGGTASPEEPDDGLTEEQREYLVFTAGINGGYAVSVNPEHADDIESIDIPAEYKGLPVTMIGTGNNLTDWGEYAAGTGEHMYGYAAWGINKTRTADSGFYACPKLKSIHLPDTICIIGSFAFCNCTALETINLPDSIVRIEEFAFCNCPNAEIDKLPSNIYEIGKDAFMECNKAFETLELPSSLKRMGNRVFRHCNGIRKVTWNLPAVPSETFSYCENLDTVIILEPTIAIYSFAFQNCSKLNNVILPETLRSMASYAFSGCKALEHIDLPESIVKLRGPVFQMTSLSELQIPPLMKEISGGLLEGNSVIEKIIVPATVENIDFWAFRATRKLNSITILNPNAVFEDALYDIGDVDGYYRTLKTIYGYSGSTTEAFCKKYGFRFKALDAQPATVVTPVVNPETEPPKTIVFKDLEPNTLYNFYDLLGEEFTSENLLFLSQGMSDKNGTLTVWYRPAKDDTDANKFVKCYETEKAEPKVYGKGLGDLNGDNSIDVSDAVLLARFCAEDKTAVITTDGLRNADVNHDGKKDGADIIRILEYIARIISSFD